MDALTANRAKAAAKVAFGAARIASGVATATGHGVIGGFLRSHHMTHHAVRFGKASVEGGMRSVREGLDDWKNA